MKEKIITRIWAASMFLISASTIVTTGANFLGITLPDLVIRALGIVNLLSLGTMGYTTMQKMKQKVDDVRK